MFQFPFQQVQARYVGAGHRAALYALTQGASPRYILSAGGEGFITEWNLDEPEVGKVIAQVETQVFSLARINERIILAGNMNGGLHWIDRLHPTETRNVLHHKKGIYDILVLEDEVWTAGGEGMLTRWDIEAQRTKESLHLSNRSLRTLALHPQLPLVAVGASDGQIYIVDQATMEIRHVITAAHTPSVFTVCWSPDGRFLLSGGRDAMLRVWDTEAGYTLLNEQAAHWYTINHIVFSPDGRYFATASRDKTIKIWATEGFELLKVLDAIRSKGHINSVNRLMWLEDTLVSCSDDRTVIFWG